MNRQEHQKNRGTVLILALWALSFLAVFAVYLGMGVRQKMLFIQHIEKNEKLRQLAESGVQKAIAVLNDDLMRNSYFYTTFGKMSRHNNFEDFTEIRLEDGFCEVSYLYAGEEYGTTRKVPGFIDEESRINVNTAEMASLKLLIQIVLRWNEEDAQDLASALVDWRGYHTRELKGFYSDSYYDNLLYPYQRKKDAFEVIDELLLVRGMNDSLLERLLPFITIYGDGAVNINTASAPVLLSLGLPEQLVDKILAFRRGPDGEEATGDDIVFLEDQDLIALLEGGGARFSAQEIQRIRAMVEQQKIKTNSRYYFIQSEARLPRYENGKKVACVFDAAKSKIIYWRES